MHDRCALKLLLAVARIDRRTGVTDAEELQNFHLPRFGIDFDFRGSRGGEPILRALFRLPGFRVHVRRGRLANRFRRESGAYATELGEKNFTDRHTLFFHAAYDDPAVAHEEIVWVDLQLGRDHFAQLFLYLPGGHAHGVAHMIRRPAAGRNRIVRCYIGVRLDDMDAVGRNAQFLGHDLSHRGLRSLAHLYSAAEHVGAAVGVENNNRARDRRRQHRFHARRDALTAQLGATLPSARLRPLDGLRRLTDRLFDAE